MASSILPFTLDVEDARPEIRASSLVPRQNVELSTETRNAFREGMNLLEMGEPKQAIVCLREALTHAPEYSDGHVGLGIALAMDSQVYPAIDSFTKAAELDASNFYAHFKLAQFYFKLRAPKKGYEEADKALHCALGADEKRLVAQILREERAKEAGGVARPTWNKPFSKHSLRTGLVIIIVTFALLLLRMR
jgi:tetratricopeptide (TPR) repeat protein